MPVFISHRTTDDKIAQAVANRLKYTHGSRFCFDDYYTHAKRYMGG